MVKEKTSSLAGDSKVSHDDRVLAAIGYIWVLFIVPLLVKRDNEFVQFHAKQGLVLFVFEVVVIILGWLPVLGWFVIMPIGTIAAIALAVMGIVNTMQGRLWEMPFLAKYAQKIKF